MNAIILHFAGKRASRVSVAEVLANAGCTGQTHSIIFGVEFVAVR